MKIRNTLFMFVFTFVMAFGSTGKINTKELFRELGLEKKLSFEIFEKAIKGYEKIPGRKKDVLSIVDFSKPSTAERFFVIDVANKKVLVNSHVTHGRNSGMNMATSFSNVHSSYQSSLGFYLTEDTYYGGNGYSLNLEGLEQGINHNAKDRRIVVHGASYANPSVIKAQGRLGRSLGCPALPEAISRSTIDQIKQGSVMYIHGNDKTYEAKSRFI